MRRFSFLCRCVAAGALLGSPALAAQPSEPVPRPSTDGPRLIGHGTALTPRQQSAYDALTAECPDTIRVTLVGGAMSDAEVILVVVVVALVVVVIIVAVC